MSFKIPNLNATPIILPDATSASDGIMLAADKAKLDLLSPLVGVQSTPGTLQTVYIRSTGNDTTGDGTLARPYLTQARALQDCYSNPAGRSFRVDMTDYGTYTPTALLNLPVIVGGQTNYMPDAELQVFGTYRNADIEFYAEPTVIATFVSGQYTVAQYGGSANKAAHTEITITSSPGWTVNEHVGKLVVKPGGSGCARVISNTANTLVVTFVYSSSTTATIKLCTESCSIDMTTSLRWLASGFRGRGVNYSITVAGINFVNGFYADNGFTCYGEFRFIACKGVAVAGHNGEYLELTGCTLRLVFAASCDRVNVWNCTYADLSIFSNNGRSFGVSACYGTGGDSIGEGAYHGQSDTAGIPRYVSVFYTTHRDTGRGGVRLVGQGNTLVVGYCHFEACSYGGVVLQWNARGFINGPISGPTGTGTPSSAGVIAYDDSEVLVAQTADSGEVLDSTNITVTGANGDLVLGDDPVGMPWTTFFTKKNASDILRAGARATQVGTKQRLTLMKPTTAVKTAAYVAVDYEIVRCNPTAGTFAVTFPAAASSSRVTIVNQSANATAITLTPGAGDTIGGAASASIAVARGSRTYESDGVSDWMLTASA